MTINREDSGFSDRFAMAPSPSTTQATTQATLEATWGLRSGGWRRPGSVQTPHATTQADLGAAVLKAMEGWPEYHILPLMGAPRRLLPNSFPRHTSDGLSPRRVSARGGGDSVTLALAASGARRVDSRHVRMLYGPGDVETP